MTFLFTNKEKYYIVNEITKKYFGNKEFYKKFFEIALPVMLATLITNIVNFADNFMVGNYSNVAVSAVYSANQVTFVFNILCFGIIGGAGIYIQQLYGAKKNKELQEVFHLKLYIMAALVLVVVPLIYVFGENLIKLFSSYDTDGEAILIKSYSYLKIAIFSFIPFALTVCFSSTLREVGHTRIPVYSSIVSLVVNIVLNYLLIYGFDGFEAMGVEGAAIATLTARSVECLILVSITIYKKYTFIQNFFHTFFVNINLLKSILIKTIPITANELLWSLGMTFFAVAYSRRGDVLSALSIASTTSELYVIIITGFGTGIGVMVGHELGKGNVSDAKENSLKLIVACAIAGLFIAVILAALSTVVPLAFPKVTSEQKQLATYLILDYASCCVFFSINFSIFVVLKSGGKAIESFLMDSTYTWVIAVPLAFVLTYFTDLPLILVYLLVQATDIPKMIIGIYFYKKGNWANDLVR